MRIDPHDPETITVYTDGSCDNKSRKGGWAFDAEHRGARAHRFGFAEGVSSNMMELLAITRALQFIPASRKSTSPLLLFSDSAYAIGAMTEWHEAWKANGWRTSNGSPVSNLDLIKKALRLLDAHQQHRAIELRKVKGHAGLARNEFVDALAGNARKQRASKWDDEVDTRLKVTFSKP